tara:strand:+ start:1382 stop:2233 length:852 start_codon:yes stop_codon:yes gene_type:complete
LNKALIPIAGLGTRLLPATKAIPKEMMPIVNKPLIQLIVEEVIDAGFKEIIFITHSSKYSVENHFDKSFELEATLEKRVKRSLLKEIKALSNLKVSFQSVRQGHALGLGHAISCGQKITKKEPFAVILPDMLLKYKHGNNLKDLKLKYEETGLSQILLAKAKKKELSNYGVVKIKKGVIESIVEKPKVDKTPSNLFAAGRYIFTPEIFNFISRANNLLKKEIELTDAIQKFINNDNLVQAHVMEGKYFDCGGKIGYLKAIIDFAIEDKDIGKEFRSYLNRFKI